MQFRAVCSKWNQKLTLSLSASNIDEARGLLHGQWYSIMEIQEISHAWEKTQEENAGNFFFFDAMINGQVKSWKIQSIDVFKAYKKLVDDLGYNIVYIYTTEWMNEQQKKTITAKVKDGYMMYKQSMGFDVSEKKIQSEKETDMQEISPQMLKELAHYTTIIDSTIEKIQNLFLKYHNTITPEKKIELENIENTLAQGKWMSNIWRMKLLVENALNVIGRVESELIKTWTNGEKKKILDETNSLLKQIGSSSRIETKETASNDITKTLTSFLNSFNKKETSKVEQKKKVDTNSFIFYKNLRELNIYKANLNKVVIDILKSLITFDFTQTKRLLLKKKLLEQDIQIIDNRIHNRNISYSRIIKWTKYYTDGFLSIFQKIGDITLYWLFLYSIVFVTLHSFSKMWWIEFSLETRFFLFICIFSLIAFLFSFFRSLLSFFLYWWVFIMLFIFLSLNF
jgi:hypothetical protein